MLDEHGNRPGDWTHRTQRTRASVNKLVRDPHEKHWYDQKFWIIFFLVVFWPVGIVLLWRSDWSIVVKGILTAAVILLVIIAYNVSMSLQTVMGA